MDLGDAIVIWLFAERPVRMEISILKASLKLELAEPSPA